MYYEAKSVLPKWLIKEWLEKRLINLNNDLGWQGYSKNDLVKIALEELDELTFTLAV